MAKKPPTKTEREYYQRVVELGCLLCGRPAEIHHVKSLRYGTGIGLRADNRLVIPLCPDHHRNGGYGVAIHAGIKGWEKENNTTEEKLLKKTCKLLGF